MIVTDITRMEGERVCVGGYLDDGTAVRPVAGRAGPDEAWIRGASDGEVRPFALVDLRVGRVVKRAQAPHTEDRAIPITGHRLVRVLDTAERVALLQRTRSPSVRVIFGAAVHADAAGPWGRYVRAGEGERSLGTIRASRVEAVRYQHYPARGRWDYRLRFQDETGETFQLAVVDLAFRRRLDQLRASGLPAEEAAQHLLREIQGQTAYLRIGLARGWARHPDRCYLQITGVYGFGVEESRSRGEETASRPDGKPAREKSEVVSGKPTAKGQ
jgi:hypothetical protein